MDIPSDVSLHSVQTTGFHFHEPVFPVETRNSKIMKAPGNVTKWLAIFQETVVFVVNDERSRFRVTYCTYKGKEEEEEVLHGGHRGLCSERSEPMNVT